MTGTQPRTKLQHYVPRFYLERFTNADGFVWVYDIKSGQSRADRPEAIGAETNFYSPIQKDGSRFDDMERWLSEIESAAAPLLEPLSCGKRLIGQDRNAVSTFLAAQYLRSPMMVHAMADMMGQTAHELYMRIANSKSRNNEIFDEIDKRSGSTTSPDKRERILQFLSSPRNIHLNVLRDVGLPVIQGTNHLARILFDMTWVVFETKGQHIVTSDSPLVKVYDPMTYHPAYGDGGFFNKTMYATFPLTPDKTLELCWGSGDPGGVHKMDTQRGKLYNKQRVTHAVKFIFSSCRDVGISKLILKSADAQRPRITFGGPTPSITVKRKLD